MLLPLRYNCSHNSIVVGRVQLQQKGGNGRVQLKKAANHRLACPKVSAVDLLPVGLFFTPGLLMALYALVRGKGNFKDGFSHLLTDIS